MLIVTMILKQTVQIIILKATENHISAKKEKTKNHHVKKSVNVVNQVFELLYFYSFNYFEPHLISSRE